MSLFKGHEEITLEVLGWLLESLSESTDKTDKTRFDVAFYPRDHYDISLARQHAVKERGEIREYLLQKSEEEL
ncbi:MAG TPA: hypothetical protein VF600_08905 [Abditibacteriaceae bacterium]